MIRNIVAIPVDLITVGDRLREVDADWAALIAETMRERGQDNPIWVGPADPATGHHALIAGRHRLEALRIAGIAKADAVVFEGDDLQARLLEIDENLIRRELSELDRATFLAERKRIWQALHPHTKAGGDRRSDQIDKSDDLIQAGLEQRFSDATAAKLGVSARIIDRAVHRFKAIAEDVRRRIATTRTAQIGSELDALARFSHAQQRRIADELLAEESPAPNVRQAAIRIGLITPPKVNPVDEQFRRIWDLWGRTDHVKARRQFLKQLVASASKDDLATLRTALAEADGEEEEDVPADGALSSFQRTALAEIVRAHDAVGGGSGWVKKPARIQATTIAALEAAGMVELGGDGKVLRPTARGAATLADGEGA